MYLQFEDRTSPVTNGDMFSRHLLICLLTSVSLHWRVIANESTTPLENRIDRYAQRCWQHISDGSDSALYYVDLMRTESIDGSYLIGQVMALEYYGLYVELVESDLHKAIPVYLQAIEICKRAKLDYLAEMYHTLGGVFQATEDFEKAKMYYVLALESSDRQDVSFRKLCLMNLGTAYSSLQEFEKAKDAFEQSLLINPTDDVLNLSIYAGLANLSYRKKAYREALRYIHKSIDLDGSLKRSLTALILIKTKTALNDFSGADTLIPIAGKLALVEPSIRKKYYLYKRLGEFCEGAGNLEKAIEFKNKHIALTDTFNLENRNSIVQSIEQKYQSEKKQQAIDLLAAQNDLQMSEIRKNRIINGILIGSSVLLILLFLLIYNRYRARKKMNDLLEEKNRQLWELNATKDKLFSVLAHDLKNPALAFRNIAGSISKDFDKLPKDKLEDLIRQMSESSIELYDTLSNLLTWSLSQREDLDVHLDVVRPKKQIDEIYNMYRIGTEDKRITFRNEVSEHFEIRSDVNIFNTVIRNLIMNAIKFTHEGGNIRIYNNGSAIVVEDNGIGMEPETLDALFKIGKDNGVNSTDERGSGLGLILCKELLDKQGSQISVNSSIGSGSNFIVNFS